MKIDISRVAKLSRLAIEEDKLEKFEQQMNDIIAMVEDLPPLDDGGIGLDPQQPMELREDIVTPSLRREDILRNAPQSEAGCVVVPRTVE